MIILLACRYLAYAVLLTLTFVLVSGSISLLLLVVTVVFMAVRATLTMGLYESSVLAASLLIRIIPATIFAWALAFGCIEACRSVRRGIKFDRQQLRNK